jgi:hypothetical protein
MKIVLTHELPVRLSEASGILEQHFEKLHSAMK